MQTIDSDVEHNEAQCSLCREYVNAYKMVWSPSGASICGRCVAAKSSSDKFIAPYVPMYVPPSVKEVVLSGAEAIRQSHRREGARQLCAITHVYRSTSGNHACGYRCPSGTRILVMADSPWFPPTWTSDEPE